ncbi:hypothetical protein N7468_005174 [Penicillium chermesinum]|uniref:N-acetylgalactosaminide beta-1,3-galactosyltransferase n=1 Tax=Penicillium chermesinum TaxID=63820 RepID=A0A9W9NYP0_9EURO|nr:uncharacterized protein N7468_005174 [Penicillium chermesinum]KAJ5232218.1 hypothetical protein N7468_005174 [Penicillium chermesinum]KAJ6171879.1 hypothetical protein N7470_000946 [Penicillium chermesinum]
MRRAFHKDNRIVPLGIMLLTFIVFVYHFELDRQGPLGEIPAKAVQAVPNALIVESARTASRPLEEPVEAQPIKEEYQEHHAVPSAIPSAKPIVSSSSTAAKQPHSAKGLSTDDIVLMFKTGATVLWKRVPIHLTTSLSAHRINHDNVIIYSDYPETIGDWEIIDVLANTSEQVRHSELFEPYVQQGDYEARQNYAEQLNVPGDSAGSSGGWKLDKYKFLPIVDHAGRNRPDAKWYIFMEDDSYLFLPNIVRYLEKFDHTESWYLGSLAWIHGDYFAHGGSGFALSRGAWEQSFGSDPHLVQKFEAFTEAHGCGDHILGHALKEYGVQFGETTDDSRFRYGFNPESHWSTWFEQDNWCQPVYSWHHTHGRDVARFYSLEQSWDFDHRPLQFRDIYQALVAPYLRSRVEWWDNLSSKHEIRSSNAKHVQAPSTVKSTETWRSAWQSVDACEAACTAWAECVQWSFYEDLCKMDSMIFLGSGIPAGDPRRQSNLMWTSGWLPRRVENWGCQ